MRERTAYQVDRVVVQNTSGSTFWKTNRASRCKYHAPDPNPNTNRNPYPNYGDVYTSMQSTWYVSRDGHPAYQVRFVLGMSSFHTGCSPLGLADGQTAG